MTDTNVKKWVFLTVIGLLVAILALQVAAQPREDPTNLSGQLLDPDGKPLAGVWLCLCTRNLDIHHGKLPTESWKAKDMREWPAGKDQLWFVTTDVTGQFSFPAPKGNYSLLASTDAGYVIAKAKTSKAPLMLQLIRWGKIEGVVESGEKTVPAGTAVDAKLRDASLNDEIGPFIQFDAATTDGAGHFRFDRLFAGEYLLGRGGAPVKVTLPAGKTVDVTIPVRGPTVAGRIEIPETLKQRKDLHLDVEGPKVPVELPALTLPDDMLRKSPADRDTWFAAWEKSPAGQEAMTRLARGRERRHMELKPDGSFKLLDAPAGASTITVDFFGKTKEGRIDYEHRLALRSYTLKVPAGAVGADDPVLDLGMLPAQSYELADAGQPAPDFVFKTLDGKEFTLGQFRGKVVLLDFWGTWCGPCMVELPKLKAIHTAFAKDDRFVMISLSVEDEPAQVQQFVRKNGMDWMQVALGKEARTSWPIKLYQVTGYPTFYLIGRDGKMVAHGSWADDLKAVVATALEEKAVQP